MKKLLLACAFSLMLVLGISGLSYAETMDIAGLVDNFQRATDLQKEQIIKDNIGKEVSAAGTVSNAEEYDFFDAGIDLKGTYYQLLTEQQKTKNNVAYQLVFLFKNKDSVKDISKGQNILQQGKIIRISDERLQITIWLFCPASPSG